MILLAHEKGIVELKITKNGFPVSDTVYFEYREKNKQKLNWTISKG